MAWPGGGAGRGDFTLVEITLKPFSPHQPGQVA
jgi:hypothetical protein